MATCPRMPAAFVQPWTEALQSWQAEQHEDVLPPHAIDAESLITTSSPQTLFVGTGLSIFTRGILPAMLGARSSIHFVTCYWAASPSLDAISNGLAQLAASRRRRGTTYPPLQVSIGFSSWGLLQKLFHTSCPAGEAYPPSQWAKLGLPDPGTLRGGGIQLTVKSLFFRPMSVMHPKYVIVDGDRAFIPSCNVSWESWFEGCVEVRGHVVSSLAAFHKSVWGDTVDEGYSESMAEDQRENHGDGAQGDDLPRATTDAADAADADGETDGFWPEDETSATRSLRLNKADAPVATMLLPSPHHRNPRFSFFPFLSHSHPPMTPLNAALLTLFANARRDIIILTPNVTSWPVLDALLEALARGVNVQIRTNRGMMLIEQLVTAGTTTSLCLDKFIKKYEKLRQLRQRGGQARDVEAQPVTPGSLEILYYKPYAPRDGLADEPVASHFKMTMVDGQYLVLGSGNMDRASWWTSQELGVLFHVPETDWHGLWDGVLEKRMELLYRSP
ncbi:hypothetical protein E4U42_001434 [Claviceps africana]|uniref:PLD phosphodiesterase domain-containing protein n=1 Tax=Claviceps africana TaxID=83212 RepID=A0A8K0NI19_9HYPO|nr:hypothetical protein E4U42_001434 [Claviceps africana]